MPHSSKTSPAVATTLHHHRQWIPSSRCPWRGELGQTRRGCSTRPWRLLILFIIRGRQGWCITGSRSTRMSPGLRWVGSLGSCILVKLISSWRRSQLLLLSPSLLVQIRYAVGTLLVHFHLFFLFLFLLSFKVRFFAPAVRNFVFAWRNYCFSTVCLGVMGSDKEDLEKEVSELNHDVRFKWILSEFCCRFSLESLEFV